MFVQHFKPEYSIDKNSIHNQTKIVFHTYIISCLNIDISNVFICSLIISVWGLFLVACAKTDLFWAVWRLSCKHLVTIMSLSVGDHEKVIVNQLEQKTLLLNHPSFFWEKYVRWIRELNI